MNKYIPHIIYASIIIILSVIVYRQLHSGTVIVPQNQPITIYKDKKGELHTEIVNNQVDKAAISALTDSIKRLNSRIGTVTTITEFVTLTDTVFRNKVVYIDTNDNFTLQHKDNYVSVEAKGNLKQHNADIKYSSLDTLQVVAHIRKHLFKPDETLIDISNKNPYNNVVAGRSYTLKERKSLLVVGPSVLYSPFDNRFHYGISLTLNAFSIKTRK